MNLDRSCHVVPGTDPVFIVDGFKHSSQKGKFVFFLTHFHGDHYAGLTRSWTKSPIHCSEVTGNLLHAVLGVRKSQIKPLELHVPHVMHGVTVTLLDAHHCPGAVMLLFKLPNGKLLLHTGDFRYHPTMKDYHSLQGIRLDSIFLDTTYCHPRHSFVAQQKAIDDVVNVVRQALKDEKDQTVSLNPGEITTDGPSDESSCLFLVSSYTIGKEKVAMAIARTFSMKIFVSPRKLKIINCLLLPKADKALFTERMSEANVQLVPMRLLGTAMPYFQPDFANLKNYLETNNLDKKFNKVIGFIPTGWAHTGKYNNEHAVQ
eukprot:GHVT01098024.1.p1 GENE.GHVT01098024.1~~GHVT01098024.1.p1  ORF type:complete len:317 (+),score=16.64 GHVT01098024.1:256-1206(+)